MAYSETFTRKCSTSGPSYTYYINSCGVTSYYDYKNQYKNTYSYSDYKDNCTDVARYSDTKTCSDHDAHAESWSSSGYCTDYDYYANSTSCTNTTTYKNTSSCSTYTECADYSFCSTCSECADYSSCSTVAYKNSNNRCQVQWTYTNYADAYNTKTGGALSLSWDSSIWGVSKYKKITPEIMESLKSNITKLCTSKGRNRVENPTASFTSNEEITSSGIENLRNTLEKLYDDLKQISSGTSAINEDEIIENNSVASLKSLASSLAKEDITYVNYLNSSYANSTQGSTPNTSYINSVVGTTPAAAYTNYSEIRYS